MIRDYLRFRKWFCENKCDDTRFTHDRNPHPNALRALGEGWTLF